MDKLGAADLEEQAQHGGHRLLLAGFEVLDGIGGRELEYLGHLLAIRWVGGWLEYLDLATDIEPVRVRMRQVAGRARRSCAR